MAHTPWFVGKTLKKTKQRKRHAICHNSQAVFDENRRTDVLFPGVGASYVDPEVERSPPPSPTVVTFPTRESYSTTAWNTDNAAPHFGKIFGSITKPREITKDHVEALNVEYAIDQALEELLPSAPSGSSFLPATTADQACEITEYADPKLSSMEQQRRQEEFHSRLAELRIDNDTAYRTLARNFKNGTRGARLAHMRKFYEGLESMSRYWECASDKYFEVLPKDDPAENERRVKRIRLGDQHTIADDTVSLSSTENVQASPVPAIHEEIMAPLSQRESYGFGSADSSPAATCGTSHSGTASPEPAIRTRYKGRRTHTGNEMPDTFRSETVKSFVEGIVWPFRCSVHPPRVMPMVHFGTLNVPVRQTAAVYRQPDDRARARQGHLVGPLFAVQARAETGFDESASDAATTSRLDLLRELGASLQIAQERRREGRTEVKPGESKWWTTKPRFGGAPHDVSEAANEVKSDELVDPAHGVPPPKPPKIPAQGTRSRSPSSTWKQLRCGSGYWDQKTQYMAIGKDPSCDYDEVFTISSLNHHISILKLSVHGNYTDYLVSGTFPKSHPEGLEWSQAKLQRSKWFDMFDVEQRVDAYRGIWGVMAFLTRSIDTSDQPEHDAA